MPPLRKVHFYRITTIERTHDRWTLDIHCSSGTYIRSLAHDMGERLGCGAHLDSLRRTRSGLFSLDDSIQLEDISVQWEKGLIPLDSMLTEIPAFELTDEGAARVSHGNPISCDSELSGTFRLVFETHLLAIGEAEEGILKPKTVFCQG